MARETSFEFDHLVIGASDLDKARDWAKAVFGVEVPLGGAHPDMGTHNRLARLPAGYLELIAIDPHAPEIERARWYGLDDPAVQARISERPRPVAWVLAVEDLDAAADQAGWDVGDLITARRGDLSWRIAVPGDGAVVEGVLPALIEWPAALGRKAPTGRMVDVGLALRELRIRHPEPRRITALLETVDAFAAAGSAGFALRVEESDGETGQEIGLEAVFMRPHIAVSL